MIEKKKIGNPVDEYLSAQKMTPSLKLKSKAEAYMSEFQRGPQNDHLYPWVAAKIGFIAGVQAQKEEAKKYCPCGDVILADTEDWIIPMCCECGSHFVLKDEENIIGSSALARSWREKYYDKVAELVVAENALKKWKENK